MMTSIIDKARIKQRSVIITLIDMTNAFGEVRHKLIKEVLNHHHLPLSIQTLISIFMKTFRLPSLLITLPLLLFPSVQASLKGIPSAPYFSTYALIHLFKSLSKRNTNNSVSLHMILLIVSLTLFIGYNSQMTQRSLQLTSSKINSF